MLVTEPKKVAVFPAGIWGSSKARQMQSEVGKLYQRSWSDFYLKDQAKLGKLTRQSGVLSITGCVVLSWSWMLKDRLGTIPTVQEPDGGRVRHMDSRLGGLILKTTLSGLVIYHLWKLTSEERVPKTPTIKASE